MAKNYQQLAEQIIPLVGGKENIKAVRHCQTRLRFTLADESKADDKALEALDGVRKVLRSAGVYQVVIGTDVADLFAVLEPLCGLDNASDKAEDAPAEKKNPVSVIIDFVAGTSCPCSSWRTVWVPGTPWSRTVPSTTPTASTTCGSTSKPWSRRSTRTAWI